MSILGQNGKIVLAVTTLQYQKKMVDCLLDLISSNIIYGRVIPECCLLPQARNKAIEVAYEQFPDFSHILFIDDDMCNFTTQHVARLFASDVEIISGLMTCRQPPYKIVSIFSDLSDAEIIENIEKQRVVQVKQTGMGFTLIKKKVFDELREETVSGPIWFNMDRKVRDTFEVESLEYVRDILRKNEIRQDDLLKAISFGVSGHIGATMLGEDISFCRDAQSGGFPIYVDCGCPVGHIGMSAFDYRYSIMNCRLGEDDEKDNSVVDKSPVVTV